MLKIRLWLFMEVVTVEDLVPSVGYGVMHWVEYLGLTRSTNRFGSGSTNIGYLTRCWTVIRRILGSSEFQFRRI